ncbi:MAG: hypothetical protein MJ175_12030 [Clostridia bacterium]|nr:hypothetical protein [Clostridia bacterium]
MQIPNKPLTEMDRIELCTLAMKLCDLIRADAPDEFRGGIYPSNITIHEDGTVSLGQGRQDSWDGEELKCIAPELHWAGRRSPAADVYTLGLLLYYGVTGGKLPFEGETKNPEQTRMSGERFPAPPAAGPNLGAVITKATSFNISGRYQTMEEMKKALLGCVNNLFLMGALDVREVFGKKPEELNEMERMMAGIMKAEQNVIPDAVRPAPQDDTAILAPEAFEETEASREEQARREEALRQFKKSMEEAATEAANEKAKAFMEGIIAESGLRESTAAEPAKVTTRVGPVTQGNPDEDERLEPIYFSTTGVTPAVRYTRNLERERKLRAEMKRRRRRPILVILLLCILLIAGAAGYNKLTMMRAGLRSSDSGKLPAPPEMTILPPTADSSPDGPGQAETAEEPEPTAEVPEETPAPKEHEYRLFVEDVSWTEAERKCEELGGHLIVINNAEELQMVIDLAEEARIAYVWIGLHRTPDDGLIWSNGDLLTYYRWGQGEPSKFDGNIEENYVMLWNLNGWFYNDTIDDPAGEFPEMYGGRLGYVCEIE